MTAILDAGTLFDLWAEVYDTQPNPLLQLEERLLPALLPPIRDADVMDVGCGTGRWLARLNAEAPRSLAGCDPSAAMLQRARTKLPPSTTLHTCDATRLPGASSSRDFLLASFVVSYIDDLPAFTRECTRVLRPGGAIVVTDMHPDTAAERNWTRSFATGGKTLHLPAQSRPISQIIAAFAEQGFTVSALREAAFAEPEQQIFERGNKHEAYLGLLGIPAIYLLKLSKVGPLQSRQMTLRSATWAASPCCWSTKPLSMIEGRITFATTHSDDLDLGGYVLLPGLINAHDHLEFALFPNLGRAPAEPKYQNAPEWAAEIHQTHAGLIRRHQSVPLTTRLWFGALRNLLCGVTTVCHHNPIHAELLAPEFPVRVLTHFGWAHSLNFGPNPAEVLRDSSLESPFIMHACEGIDSQSRAELYELDCLGVLDHRAVLVHGLALTMNDIALVNERGASVVLCPTSNRFLFGRMTEPDVLRQIALVALGSDSPLTAAGDLLDEIRTVREQEMQAATLYNMVTVNPAQILRLKEGEGVIQQGGRADVIAVREKGRTPAETLGSLSLKDIELVIADGRVQVVSHELYRRLPSHHRTGMHLLQIAGIERWIRAPLPELFASAEAILGQGNIRIGHKEARHIPSD